MEALAGIRYLARPRIRSLLERTKSTAAGLRLLRLAKASR